MTRLVEITVMCVLVFSASAHFGYGQRGSEIDQAHTKWIANALQVMQAVKVGMTRSDLLKVFTTEGGLSTTSQQTYVYRQCPYIKVDVRFAASSDEKELPTDKIVEISRPYLAWSVFD